MMPNDTYLLSELGIAVLLTMVGLVTIAASTYMITKFVIGTKIVIDFRYTAR